MKAPSLCRQVTEPKVKNHTNLMHARTWWLHCVACSTYALFSVNWRGTRRSWTRDYEGAIGRWGSNWRFNFFWSLGIRGRILLACHLIRQKFASTHQFLQFRTLCYVWLIISCVLSSQPVPFSQKWAKYHQK